MLLVEMFKGTVALKLICHCKEENNTHNYVVYIGFDAIVPI